MKSPKATALQIYTDSKSVMHRILDSKTVSKQVNTLDKDLKMFAIEKHNVSIFNSLDGELRITFGDITKRISVFVDKGDLCDDWDRSDSKQVPAELQDMIELLLEMIKGDSKVKKAINTHRRYHLNSKRIEMKKNLTLVKSIFNFAFYEDENTFDNEAEFNAWSVGRLSKSLPPIQLVNDRIKVKTKYFVNNQVSAYVFANNQWNEATTYENKLTVSIPIESDCKELYGLSFTYDPRKELNIKKQNPFTFNVITLSHFSDNVYTVGFDDSNAQDIIRDTMTYFELTTGEVNKILSHFCSWRDIIKGNAK